MFCEEAKLKKNTFSALADFCRRRRLCRPSSFIGSAAAFSLPDIWKETNTVLLLVVVLVVVIVFVWFIFRRRSDSYPEIKFNTERPVLDKDLTAVESLPEGKSWSNPSPGIYGKIEVIVGHQPISTYLVTDNPLTIGRDPAQALVIIQEAIVSKLHCSIFSRAGQIFIKDLNSTNGTYVNSEKVSELELNDNDTVFLGKKGTVKLVYHK
jgi:hypothetical protein